MGNLPLWEVAATKTPEKQNDHNYNCHHHHGYHTHHSKPEPRIMPTLVAEQDFGANWLADRLAAVLGDRAGFGKTAQAIVGAQRVGAQRLLIVCPAIARLNWERELILWGWDKPIDRITKLSDFACIRPGKPQALIVSYEAVRGSKRVRGLLNEGLWDVMVCDEAHRLKTPDSNQTRSIYGAKIDRERCLSGKAVRVWLLSGSIMLNHAGEVWTHLHSLWPELIADVAGRPLDHDQFVLRFCNTQPSRFGPPKIIGLKDRNGLVSILQTVMLRREVIQGLPELVIRTEPYAVEADAAALARLELEYAADLEDLVSVLESADARGKGLDEVDDEFIHLATLRRLTGLIKARPTAEVIAESMAPDDKQLVFCMHRDVITEVVDVFTKAGMQPAIIHGGVPDGKRNAEIDRFQTDPSCRVVVAQVQACQEVVTLTAANRVGFVESPWSPEAMHQAICRAHRRGQKKQVWVDSYSLPGSIDEQVAKVVARKAAMLESLMDANYSQSV